MILDLRNNKGMTWREIGYELGISASTVYGKAITLVEKGNIKLSDLKRGQSGR